MKLTNNSNHFKTKKTIMYNKKPLTKQDVKDTAEALMLANGSTTTLEVKNDLRSNDFEARQLQVSDLMRELAAEENWDFVDNGTHRTYSSQMQTMAASVSSTVASTQTTPTPVLITAKTATVAGQTIDVVAAKDAATTDWKATSPLVPGKILYFDSSCTRDQARGAYAKLVKIAFKNTRAARIK